MRASDAKAVSETDYRGQLVMLYFGYTFCPDVCPTTLANIAEIMQRLGSRASSVTFLFVTVDPDRDSLPVLTQYVSNFGPRIVALRGDPDQLASLARRYRLVYSVTPARNGHPYEVTHSAAIYVFDATGAARLLIPNLAAGNPGINSVAADLEQLLTGS
jgi:protein SCO1/2